MRFIYRMGICSAAFVLRLIVRNRVYIQKSPLEGGAILASNHASYLDPPLVATSWPHEIHFLAGEYLFRIPLFSLLIRKLNSHPIHRGKADLSSIKLVCQLVKEGNQVLIFPEGTRSPDGQMKPFKSGLAMIATRVCAPIVPVYVRGSYEAFKKGDWFPRFGKQTAVVFGSPILWKEFDGLQGKELQKAILERVESAILNLKRWHESGAQGEPP